MKKAMTLALLMLVTVLAHAQMLDPVKFSSQLKTGNTAEGEIVFTGKIDKGWHVYSTGLGADGPISATFNVNKLDGVELVGRLTPKGHEIKSYDKLFEMTLRYFENSVQFVQKVRFTKPSYTIDAYLEYGACNDQNCLPPTSVDLKKSGKSPAVAAAAKGAPDAAPQTQGQAALQAGGSSAHAAATAAMAPGAADSLARLQADSAAQVTAATAGNLSAADKDALWRPVVKQLQQFGGTGDIANKSVLYIFLMGLVGGLLALVMPCIWPIIPMTVSFFLKRSKDDRKRGVRDAMTYGIAIVVIYLGLGIGVTAVFGPSTLNSLSTNAVFNIFLFLLLVVFAVSFFGWFEIKLPDSWANKVDTKASNTTGLLSIFLMAFTLVLVSFSCTAPIIGLLLVQTVTSGNWLAPAVGMLGFALALAVPFTLFAMFPTLMKKSPKSGAWMTQIKVVLGFVELAFALKFFSVADLAYGWHLLDREVFLSLWIVIFLALGWYLIGWLKFPEDQIGGDLHKPMPVPAIMLGLCSLAFAIYMVPGLWGAPCKAVSAFAPPMNTQDFNLNTKTVEAKYTNYEEGMAAAKAQGKPVLIDFTGFGCVNCRKMEAAVWTDPQVSDKLEKDYVLISLYVDDKTPLPQPMQVEANGQTRTLRTVGDKWSYLQSHKFGANAQPFYVALDNEGNPLTGSFSYKEDVPAYLDFLNKGLDNYAK
ncbi:thiol:disulfide interchange protein dsbD precursor [Prevotella dentalis DSM 3688]|uniref:Thiol:disulfide interchange protein dsbD n=2 Tax=Prevotella dentalis (strain ATCC 49559 / DSM 3688 / JCM 13448 / NCTC 12043 / ES 2772) TaxID=908937 RepID=F9D2B9_PREDD|nr:cytochrome c biogenesis protein CcdA [Prevotella dentalis]EGQ15713.1 thiol:disulfide interchange protein dsbD precursor [Prevotella dentalis DSM 3688]